MGNRKEFSLTSVELLPLFLGALGLVMVFPAASGISVYKRVIPVLFIKQMVIFIFALILFFITSRIKPKAWGRLGDGLIIFTVLLLILTYMFGTEINYARRWLYIGNISFQPSIFAQFSIIIFLARKRDFRLSISIITIITGLIMIQPDISTALITAFLGLVMMYINGTNLFKIMGFSLFLLLTGAGYIVSQGYALARITNYMNSESVSNTVRAISTGGLSGLGLGSGMNKFFYIPLAESDFIFSIVGEELGFTGSILIMGLFLVYFISASRYSLKANDHFIMALGLGLISMIFINALIHIFVALGSIPVTGIPLPYISSGGTALVIDFIAGGIIVAIAKNRSGLGRRNRGSYIPGALNSR